MSHRLTDVSDTPLRRSGDGAQARPTARDFFVTDLAR